jgi:hypothetical protein
MLDIPPKTKVPSCHHLAIQQKTNPGGSAVMKKARRRHPAEDKHWWLRGQKESGCTIE